MARLLAQDWFVARRTGMLWLICAVMFAATAFSKAALDGSNMTPGLGFVYAFFAAVYLGDAGTSGRLDGQIIAGSSRLRVYVCALLVLLACFVLILLCTLGGELAGTALTGSLDSYVPDGYLVYAAGLVANAAAYAGIFTLIGMAVAGRRPGRGTVMLIVSICIVFGAAIWGSEIDSRLMQPEYTSHIEVGGEALDVYGTVSDTAGLPVQTVSNPAYVREPERSRLMTMEQFLPVSQAALLIDISCTGPTPENARTAGEISLYCVLLMLGTGAAGALLFRERELD